MKSKILLILLILLFPTTAASGNIYGKIEIQKKDVDEETTYLKGNLKIECGNELYKEKVKIPGTYEIYVEKTGKCKLTIIIIGTEIGKQELDYKGPVLSAEEPLRYNFILKENNEGSYSLKRN